MKRFEDWVEIFYPRYLMRCVKIKDTVLDFWCLIFKKGLAMHPLVHSKVTNNNNYNTYAQCTVLKLKKSI
jgi:hypothetical protein